MTSWIAIYLTGLVMMLWFFYIGAKADPSVLAPLGKGAVPMMLLLAIFWPATAIWISTLDLS